MNDDFWDEQARIEREGDLSLAGYFDDLASRLKGKNTILRSDLKVHNERLQRYTQTAQRIRQKWELGARV